MKPRHKFLLYPLGLLLPAAFASASAQPAPTPSSQVDAGMAGAQAGPADQALVGTRPAPAQQRAFFMRHLPAEEGSDPHLSPAGRKQANALADQLAGAGIQVIFATRTVRAMETAAPLAHRLGIKVAIYDPKHPEAVAAAASRIPGGVLIIAHSNTLGDMIAHFNGFPPRVGEQDFGTIYEMYPGSRGVLSLEVGGPSPDAPGGPAKGRKL